jgi:muconolactone D-isomerase
MEYLVTMTTHVPDGTPDRAVDDVRAREAARSAELAAAGHLLRLWRPPLRPGEWRSLGLFAAADGGQLEEVLASMPLRVWRQRRGDATRGGNSAKQGGGSARLTRLDDCI